MLKRSTLQKPSLIPLLSIFVFCLTLSLHAKSIERDMEMLVVAMTPEVGAKMKKKLRKLGNYMCTIMEDHSGETYVERSRKIVKSFMSKALKKKDRVKFDDESHKDEVTAKENKQKNNVKILSFLNEVKSHLFCDHPQRGKEHYMVFAENSNNPEKLFNEFLNMLNPYQVDGVVPDVNVIVTLDSNGQPETYLDFFKRKYYDTATSESSKNAFMAKIKEFQRMYDAKYYHELAP